MLYVNLTAISQKLEQPGKINSLLIAGNSPDQPASEQASQQLAESFHPTFADYGFLLKEVQALGVDGEAPEANDPAFHYYSVASERLLLEEPTEAAAGKAFPNGQVVFTYFGQRNSQHQP